MGRILELITRETATALTEWSERTFWRRVSDASVVREIHNGKSMIRLDSIVSHVCIPLDPESIDLIVRADAASAVAQTDLALLFLENDKPRGAIYWLQLAAKQDHPDAMQLLGRCYTDGRGIARDDNLGIMWIAKAAALGQAIAVAQMQGLSG